MNSVTDNGGQQVILIAEDDDNDFFLLSHAFSQIEPDVKLMRVVDGVEAVAYLEGTNGYGDRAAFPIPQLVITDLKMPRKDGFEVIKWMRSSSVARGMVVVAFSASDEPSDVRRAYALGANSYLSKPTETAKLFELVRILASYWLRWSHCDQRSYERQTVVAGHGSAGTAFHQFA